MGVPLLITADSRVREDVLRLAAAAGVAPDVAGAADALAAWPLASLVIVGADLAAPMARLRPGRREAVCVVAHGPAAPPLYADALALGAETVVDLHDSSSRLVEALTDAGDLRPARGVTVGVIGGAGGVGASTFACALGQWAARSSPTLLIDADVRGPGLDRLLGLDDLDGVRWDTLLQTAGRLSARSLAEAVPRREGLGVVAWRAGETTALTSIALREVISSARRGHDHVVIDLPRGADEAADDAAARCDLLVLLVPATLPGLASSARVAARLPRAVRTEVVLRGAGLAPAEVAGVVGAPVLSVLSEQRRLGEAVDLGTGPLRSRRGPLARAVAEVWGALRPAVAA